MSKWISDCFNLENERERRNRNLERRLPLLWEKLLEQVRADIKFYNQGAGLASRQLCLVLRETANRWSITDSEQNKVFADVVLNASERTIQFGTEGKPEHHLRILPDQDGSPVLLKSQGDSELSVEGASQHILFPVLFPDLARAEEVAPNLPSKYRILGRR